MPAMRRGKVFIRTSIFIHLIFIFMGIDILFMFYIRDELLIAPHISSY